MQDLNCRDAKDTYHLYRSFTLADGDSFIELRDRTEAEGWQFDHWMRQKISEQVIEDGERVLRHRPGPFSWAVFRRKL